MVRGNPGQKAGPLFYIKNVLNRSEEAGICNNIDNLANCRNGILTHGK